MKRLFFTALLFSSIHILAQDKLDFYTKHWSDVHKFELKNLPVSALKATDLIYERAKAEKNYIELTKAIIFQAKFASAINEDHELLIVEQFKKEIADSQSPQKNLLENMLATIYWRYYQKNRWQFYQRTRTAEKENEKDFRTWDLHTIFDEIDTYYQRSLSEADILQNIRIEEIDKLLLKHDGSEIYRPTLYDFLAHNALKFYVTSESRLVEPINKFNLGNGNLFRDYQIPINNQFEDSLSLNYRTISLYQKLLNFHENQNDTAAFVVLELDRLAFLKRESDPVKAKESYREALIYLESRFQNHESSASINFEIADFYFEAGNEYDPERNNTEQFSKKKALVICEKAINKYPESAGAERCKILKAKILQPSLSLTAERYIPSKKRARVLVSYSNIDQLKFSMYKVTQKQKEQFRKLRADSSKYAQMNSLSSEDSWEINLKTLGDYQKHSTECIIPPLNNGQYLILAEVPGEQNIYAYEFIQVTDLVLAHTLLENKQRYQVLNRNNGKPIENAKVVLYNQNKTDQMEKYLVTDEMGFAYLMRNREYSRYFVRVSAKDDVAYFGNIYIPGIYRSYGGKEKQVLEVKPFVFTDRSIYRPGQIVYFKGILTKKIRGEVSIVPDEYVEIYLNDPNDEEVAFLRLKTNEFGSVAGEFKIPDGRLTGRYHISIEEDYEYDSELYDELMGDFVYNEQYFNVEEYKRPRFEVKLDLNEGTPQLNDTINVTGKALAFMGAAISDAKVVYKVTRQVRFPAWRYWSFSRNYYATPSREIVFGDTITNGDGSFSLSFPAIPDEKIAKEEYPIFEYKIQIDVTDINGETRSDESIIKVGYHTMEIGIDHNSEMVNKTNQYVFINPKNLNGEDVEAHGKIMVYRQHSEERLLRRRPWAAPDLPIISEADFINYFPHDSYDDDSDPSNAGNRTLVFETTFNTSDCDSILLPIDDSWKSGSFFIEVEAEEATQFPAQGKSKFNLRDADEDNIPRDKLVFHRLNKSSYLPGDEVLFTVGSPSDDVSITIDIEKSNNVVDTKIIQISNSTKTISIPVDEDDISGFAIKYHYVNFNDQNSQTKIVEVDAPREKLIIETATFRDKLQPGLEETWSFSIKGADTTSLQAEMLASMYDASLDQFKPHSWRFEPKPIYKYYPNSWTNFNESFGNARFHVLNIPYLPRGSRQAYDELNWFGFSIDNNQYIKRQYLSNLFITYFDTAKIRSKVSLSHDSTKQEGYVYGKIFSKDGEVIPGVNVFIEGSSVGTVSDMDGSYTIKAKKGAKLVFSYIGLVTMSVKVKDRNIIDVEMMEDVKALSEVVVLAYGTSKKESLTAAIVEIADDEEIEIAFSLEMMEDSVIEEVVFEAVAEEGSADQIFSLARSDGRNYQLMIRGVSLEGNNNPLYIVDGVIVDKSQLNENDLASVSVLKGESAMAIYGARGVNGVILITTKSGQRKMDEELAKVRSRKKLDETAFFYPQLKTDKDGNVSFSFTTPEALTRWKLQLLAHTKDLLSVTNTLQAITTKDLMITPNTPRFLRQGDVVVLSAKVSNLTNNPLKGMIGLQLSDPLTGEEVNTSFSNTLSNRDFSVAARGNAVVSWKIEIPEDAEIVQYKIVAKAGDFSDGEQNVLPILSNRILVTESLPMHIKSGETKAFQLGKLLSNDSKTLQHHKLTLEITSNPTWYALQALPYLMEFPHECAEQTFARYYANALGLHIINSNHEIREVFESWAKTGSDVSKLELNEELKSIMIQETPWLRDAQSETSQKQQIAKLFAEPKLKSSLESAIYKLEQMQMSNGGFPWFSGSNYANRYITQHIVTGLAHLYQLAVPYQSLKTDDILKKGLKFMDMKILEDYKELLYRAEKAYKDDKSVNKYLSRKHISDLQIQYLYVHSFYNDSIISKRSKKAYEFYLNQSAQYWQEFGYYGQGMIALIHYRAGNQKVAREILASLKENSITNQSLGTYWKQNAETWRWNHAPIETQARLIEAISEIDAGDSTISETDKLAFIDNMKIWLLKNKQTNRWPTTKSTTEAIYALTHTGNEWLSVTEQLQVKVGNESIHPGHQPEVATGYYKVSWSQEQIQPDMGEVSMTKLDHGIAWGALYWQYFEELDNITWSDTPLSLAKSLFIVRNTAQGELLEKATDTTLLQIGELVRVRIELKSDRDMEFIHMKDMRAAGFEPVNVLSEYKWQDGLGYYESTKDASTNFFFDKLPKGVYVFEYDLRVNNSGVYSNGITTIESMYAPEFRSHSNGMRLIVE